MQPGLGRARLHARAASAVQCRPRPETVPVCSTRVCENGNSRKPSVLCGHLIMDRISMRPFCSRCAAGLGHLPAAGSIVSWSGVGRRLAQWIEHGEPGGLGLPRDDVEHHAFVRPGQKRELQRYGIAGHLTHARRTRPRGQYLDPARVACDGFVMSIPVQPCSRAALRDFVELVVSELHRRFGHPPTPGKNMGLDRPADPGLLNAARWRRREPAPCEARAPFPSQR